jgi:hypothetical protein
MAWVCQAGGTLLIPSGPGYHLFTREPVGEQLRIELVAGLYASPLTPGYLKKLKIA